MEPEIFFFTSTFCGLCSLVEQQLLGIIEKNNLPIKITKIDITKIPEKDDVVVCPTLVFHGFMKVCGVFDRDLLEDLVVSYYLKCFEFQQTPVSRIPARL